MLQLIKTIVLIACLVTAGLSVADHRTVKRLVVFGDSLSDQGKLYQKYFKLIPKSPPYWDGRFSNGPVWTDILAADYSIVNESEGGATVVDYTRFSSDWEYAVVTNLSKEICDFLGKHDFLPTDLVIILLGANDYIGDDPVHDDNVQRVIRDLADNIAYIQQKGAQQVLVVNLPDLGKTPYERFEDNDDVKSQVIDTHNRLLDERLSSLFSPHFLQVFDLHAHVDAVLKAPGKHSLTNVLSPCLTESTTHDSAVFMQPREQELYQALI
ncbi:SGNH/GDSL hydrolase family protein, partial [Endozoicomonas sp.]|uniref:SGNH/GDSL hydrolase family protein n=1 Tax=Endozoicomonas sp. TaxID=1892382 RepID=UPI00383A54E5